MAPHNENEHTDKEAKNLDFILVLACSYCNPDVCDFKCHDLG